MSSKIRQKILNFLGESTEIERIDYIKKSHRTTYEAIYECLVSGLSIEDTEIVYDLRDANLYEDFKPSIRKLRILFSALGKDKEATIEALDFFMKHYRILWNGNYSDGPVRSQIRPYFVIDKFIWKLEKCKNSIDELKVTLWAELQTKNAE